MAVYAGLHLRFLHIHVGEVLSVDFKVSPILINEVNDMMRNIVDRHA